MPKLSSKVSSAVHSRKRRGSLKHSSTNKARKTFGAAQSGTAPVLEHTEWVCETSTSAVPKESAEQEGPPCVCSWHNEDNWDGVHQVMEKTLDIIFPPPPPPRQGLRISPRVQSGGETNLPQTTPLCAGYLLV